MKNVLTKMLAKDLKGIVSLPDYADNQEIELIIRPLAGKNAQELPLKL